MNKGENGKASGSTLDSSKTLKNKDEDSVIIIFFNYL